MIVIKDSLRSATPLREAWGMYPFTVYVHLYCYRNRGVEGRQVADPYGRGGAHYVGLVELATRWRAVRVA